jgi:hypothetical protein
MLPFAVPPQSPSRALLFRGETFTRETLQSSAFPVALKCVLDIHGPIDPVGCSGLM